MRIAIVGTGGVGAGYGAALAKAGADVTFIARGAHLAAMKRDGLKVQSQRGDIHLGEFNRSSQHPEIGGCDDGLQTCLGSMHKKEVACARAPACLAA